MTPELLEALRQRIEAARAMLDKFPAAGRAVLEQQIQQMLAKLESEGTLGGLEAQLLSGTVGGSVGASGDKYLTYRGDIQSAAGVGGVLAFVTAHPEDQPTALFRLDADSLKLTEHALPTGGAVVAADEKTVFVAGTDRQLYSAAGNKAPTPLGQPFDAPIRAIVFVSGGRLAVLTGARLVTISTTDGEQLQSLDLPEAGTCLAADKTGQWLAAGTEKGTVVVFDGQDKSEFEPAESEKLHDGAVTALLFEPEELRFFSAGADHKLLTTHARGRLEPEDKGRDNNHEDFVTAMVWAPSGDRFLTGGWDAVLKTWPRVGGVKPAKFEGGVGRVVALAVVTAYNRPRLAVCSDDNTIRFIDLEPDGRFGEQVARVYGAVDRAKSELGQTDPRRREKVLKEVAKWDDAASLDLIANQLEKDADHQLRFVAAQLLAASRNPRAVAPLETAVNHRDEKVRVEAFKGLQTHLGATDFRPIDLALKTGKPDVGILAVKALVPRAGADDEALARLTEALNAGTWDVRKATIDGLTTVFAADPPQAGLTALGSKHGDVRATALARFYERKLLDDPRVRSAVRRRLEDDDSGVRRVAFLVSVLTRWNLANYLRKADPELHRQLGEIPGADVPIADVPVVDRARLTPDDFDVPLQATAARALDTCLRGARALSALGDPRAFGLLLQLSRDDAPAARVEVCHGLAALGDPRALARLRSMLGDPEASVRDAAYTSLARIEDTDPLGVASAGLTAAAEDVRRRGLQTLVEFVRKSPLGDPPAGAPDATSAPGWFLLVLALCDGAQAVRTEAWKAVLNLKVGGGGEPTLRFALRSTHADVRREVLTEVTAQAAEPWATPLLHEFFNDPDPGIRAEAFTQATRKAKEFAPLEAALASKYPDARRLAIEALIKRRTQQSQALLTSALHDPDRNLRQLALTALVDADAISALTEAAANEHPDVKVRAATALAKHGDPAALRPLLDLATVPEPTEKEREAAWLENAEAALLGLAELADPTAVSAIRWLVGSKHARVRKAAVEALAWSVRPGATDGLVQALPHADPAVRNRAAFGLAIHGDGSVLGRLLGDDLARDLGIGAVLAAAVALGATGDQLVSAALDATEETIRTRALFILLLAESRDASGAGQRPLACLSAKAPRVRLTGAQALELYTDADASREFLVQTLNDRGGETAWKIVPDVIDALAAVLVGGPPWVRARAVGLLAWFDEKEQAGWNQAWAVFSRRFAREIAEARTTAPPRKGSRVTAGQLKELAFGAYVGLVREQGSNAAPQAIGRIRQTALDRVFALASADARYSRAASPVLTQALGDPNLTVRTRAFEHLLALGIDRTRLGAEALEAGYTDLGVKGLELLAGAAAGDGDSVLEQVMLARTDDLAIEAAKLLAGRRGTVSVAAAAGQAAYEAMRQQAIRWLAAEYDQSAVARDHLRAALKSRYRLVREAAASELAAKKDAAAFDALVEMLRAADVPIKQQRAVEALTQLGDPRAADAFLDRLENDPAGTANLRMLTGCAAAFRRPETADRMLALADKNKEWRTAAFGAVLIVSGFDQAIEDPTDERPDRKWEEDQHPRHPAVFAKLLDRMIATGIVTLDQKLIVGATWCRSPEVDGPLGLLTTNPNDDLRDTAVAALGWRLKHRNAAPEVLLRALRHKNPTTQFLAADGLARAGRAEGLSVLLSAIEYLDDVSLRERAVIALGELGDARAVDVLLRLASEDGHALQEAAAEAIGHLKRSPESEKIGRLLERLAKGNGGVARRALAGLRWFDSASGWQLVRQRAADRMLGDWVRQTAVEQLGYKDEPANRTALTTLMLRESDTDLLVAAFGAARRLWGRDSLEPFYALLQNPEAEEWANDDDLFGGEKIVEVVSARGDPLQILTLFPKFAPAVQEVLESNLLGRTDIPVKEATAALAEADEGTVRLAARLLGRAGTTAAGAKGKVSDALAKWWTTWQERRAAVVRDPSRRHTLERATDCLRGLIWAAGRVGAGLDKLVALATERPDDPLFKPLRLEAVRCLASGTPKAMALSALETVARGTDPDARTIAADVLARHDAPRAAGLLEMLSSDLPSFRRLLAAKEVRAAVGFLQSAAGQVHYQPVALPALIAAKDVATLGAIANDRKKPEATRLGAIEGLGVMAAEPAEAVLVQVGKADGDDEDVRKAAWRALRRSKRARAARTAGKA
ncbi:HEAT repeat domain-containing protein [Fimbriiglobus ruber]|uniref:HEAT repeat protein n=1 Tax=Fimbriiglobus ruber TaxID=1908690 RepID=A0A225E2B3_9BACT|nr:HEAT repeat domain-containing protein [Fimbriiglobus ruber]OWK47383.1 HEAT repeat protein [Fimbriiglobus ruber]